MRKGRLPQNFLREGPQVACAATDYRSANFLKKVRLCCVTASEKLRWNYQQTLRYIFFFFALKFFQYKINISKEARKFCKLSHTQTIIFIFKFILFKLQFFVTFFSVQISQYLSSMNVV